jgi:hypothetical protein
MIKLNIFYFFCFLLTRINKKNLRYLSVLDTSSIVVARCILELKGDIFVIDLSQAFGAIERVRAFECRLGNVVTVRRYFNRLFE